jgi:hypothetical protein
MTAEQAEQLRAFDKVFQEQIDPLWSRFGSECRQFVEGFNAEWGSSKLQVESGSDFVMGRFLGVGEVLVQLVRENRHAFSVMVSDCSNLGACTVDQLPIGLSIIDGQLRFVFGPDVMTESALAVRLLTDLIAMDTPEGRTPA